MICFSNASLALPMSTVAVTRSSELSAGSGTSGVAGLGTPPSGRKRPETAFCR